MERIVNYPFVCALSCVLIAGISVVTVMSITQYKLDKQHTFWQQDYINRTQIANVVVTQINGRYHLTGTYQNHSIVCDNFDLKES